MVFKKKIKKEGDELTAEEAVEHLKNQRDELREKVAELEKQNQEPEPEPPVEKKEEKKINWVVDDVPTQTEPVITNIKNPAKPKYYTLQQALAILLNDMEELKKVLL